MAYRLGLTGSVGMGKSTAARLFAEAGARVWDADSAVAMLYGRGGAAVPEIAKLAPDAVRNGVVNREVLRKWAMAAHGRFEMLERVVHPLVAKDRGAFAAAHADEAVLVFEVPLLFETGADKEMDGVAVVSVPPDLQESRVLARPGMDEAAFEAILSRQMADAEKRRRADWVIDGRTLAAARADVERIMSEITGETNA